jgi:hypothetical protein
MFPVTICNLHIMSAFVLKRKMCIKSSCVSREGETLSKAKEGGEYMRRSFLHLIQNIIKNMTFNTL